MAMPIRRRSSLAPRQAEPSDVAQPPKPVIAAADSVPPSAVPSPAAPVRQAASVPARPNRFAARSIVSPRLVPRQATPDPAAPPFGRSKWPPPADSGYDAFLDWAAEGAWATPEDAHLATALFMGLVPHPGVGPTEDETPARSPGM